MSHNILTTPGSYKHSPAYTSLSHSTDAFISTNNCYSPSPTYGDAYRRSPAVTYNPHRGYSPSGIRDASASANLEYRSENIEYVDPYQHVHRPSRANSVDNCGVTNIHSPVGTLRHSTVGATKTCNYSNPDWRASNGTSRSNYSNVELLSDASNAERRGNYRHGDCGYYSSVSPSNGGYSNRILADHSNGDCNPSKLIVESECSSNGGYGSKCCAYGCSGNYGNDYGGSNYCSSVPKKTNYYKDISHTGIQTKSYDSLLESNAGSNVQSHRAREVSSWQYARTDDLICKTPECTYLPAQLSDSKDLTNRMKNEAADVIREQETMIERLRLRLLTLEQDCTDRTQKLEQAVINHGDTHLSRIQELEVQNSSLKSKMSETTAERTSLMDDLEIKLGATEHELVQTKSQLHMKQKEWERTKSEYDLNLEKKSCELNTANQRYKVLQSEFSASQTSLERMEGYLGELKSAEETRKSETALTELRDKTMSQKTRIDELGQKLQYAKTILNEKNTRLKEIVGNEKLLNEKLMARDRELEKLRNVGDGPLLKISEHNLGNARGERDKLSQDLVKAKQVIEMCRRNAHEAALKHTGVLSDLQERLLREEAAMDGLRKDVSQKDELVNRLKKSVKEIHEDKQNLMEDNLQLKAQLSKLESQHSEGAQRLESQLVHEVSSCYSDLQCLVSVCLQRAAGEEPNISSLLGMSSSSLAPTSTTTMDAPLIKSKLDKVKDLRKEIERLRSLVCNKFAEDLGEKLSCILQ